MLKKVPQAVRAPEHPLIEPRQDDVHWWERNGTFNPGVTEYNGQIVLLYRAYDDFRISRLGLAHSTDGVHFERYDHPVIDTNPTDPYERLGIEDSRITLFDGTYYIVHTSASYHSIGSKADVRGSLEHIPWRVRVGMHTTTDFKHFKHWGIILPNIPAKNAALLPEKINGAFGMYYREHDAHQDILKIAFTYDFTEWFAHRTVVWPAAEEWQKFKFGIGSQPIATPEGFLNVYHAVDMKNVYRLGLMMFDRNDPSKILWHSNPILEPEMSYEKQGFVPNVVYTCGALIRDKELIIYYGGADRIIARANMSLDEVY